MSESSSPNCQQSLIRSLQSLTVLFNIGSTDSLYSDVIYSIYIYEHTHTRSHAHTHTHTLYIMIDYVMPPVHRFITCVQSLL